MSNLRIGFAFDNPSSEKALLSSSSIEAEYEDLKTLSWMRQTLCELGKVIDFVWSKDIVRRFSEERLDVIFNITEGNGGRNRESLVPAVAEALGIACTGSDALCLGIALDKAVTKIIALRAQVPTPPFVIISTKAEWHLQLEALESLSMPVIAKPNSGGSSLGINSSSKVDNLTALKAAVEWVLLECGDRVLVEEFVPGREFGFGLIETASGRENEQSLKSLPIAEIQLVDASASNFYSFERKKKHEKRIICPGDLQPAMAAEIETYSRRIYAALGCQDLARVDFRLDQAGVPYFLEINPLPGLSPFYSIFTEQALAAGIEPRQVIHTLVNNALNRRRVL